MTLRVCSSKLKMRLFWPNPMYLPISDWRLAISIFLSTVMRCKAKEAIVRMHDFCQVYVWSRRNDECRWKTKEAGNSGLSFESLFLKA